MAEQAFVRTTPESVGIPSAAIEQLAEYLTAAKDENETHAFLIIRHGKLAAEGYFDPYRPDLPHTLYSCSKTLTSCAVGFAVQEGYFGIDDRIADYFPEYLPAEPGEGILDIRIRHLLSMCFGQTGDAVHEVSDKTEKDIRYDFFRRRVVHKPGTVFSYDKYGSYMLSALIQKLTGTNLMEYLKPRLFDPLSIPMPYDVRDRYGICIGYSGVRLAIEDFAKIGQLFLNGGKWNGKQLLSEEWIRLARKKHIPTDDCSTGPNWQEGYCFQFWRGKHNTFRFCGAFGQMCVVMPDYDALFVTQSGYDNTALSYILESFYDTVMKSMQNKPLPPDPRAVEKLGKRLASLALPYRMSAPSPLLSLLDGNRYALTEPCAGYESIRFAFRENTCRITLEKEKGEAIAFDAGLAAPMDTPSRETHFVTADAPDETVLSAYAYWERPDAFCIHVRLIGTPTILFLRAEYDCGERLFRVSMTKKR